MKVVTSALITLMYIMSSVFCRIRRTIRVEKKEGGCHQYRDVEGAAKAIDELGLFRDNPSITHYIQGVYSDEDLPIRHYENIVAREVCTFTNPVTNSEEVTDRVKPFVRTRFNSNFIFKKEGCKYPHTEVASGCGIRAVGARNDFVEYRVCEATDFCVISASAFDLKDGEFRKSYYDKDCYYYLYVACKKIEGGTINSSERTLPDLKPDPLLIKQ
ncbi:hypothetical protein AX774_g1446 [Zancudomyces culisetae]|uniref:Uncharacterized protein n=1 Tax=Zancudomyces culisetae TaxID=1213189 RepID=A0A1R1PVM1_ZANCU|nr:hypothetical protein AX774_g1446 [Zancudomyces culisetae]|eukprot:OMH85016.1 hypothetical protein AX774_g1446 [Zancudomyces culisetae]